jgi:hypothetical protein
MFLSGKNGHSTNVCPRRNNKPKFKEGNSQRKTFTGS